MIGDDSDDPFEKNDEKLQNVPSATFASFDQTRTWKHFIYKRSLQKRLKTQKKAMDAELSMQSQAPVKINSKVISTPTTSTRFINANDSDDDDDYKTIDNSDDEELQDLYAAISDLNMLQGNTMIFIKYSFYVIYLCNTKTRDQNDKVHIIFLEVLQQERLSKNDYLPQPSEVEYTNELYQPKKKTIYYFYGIVEKYDNSTNYFKAVNKLPGAARTLEIYKSILLHFKYDIQFEEELTEILLLLTPPPLVNSKTTKKAVLPVDPLLQFKQKLFGDELKVFINSIRSNLYNDQNNFKLWFNDKKKQIEFPESVKNRLKTHYANKLKERTTFQLTLDERSELDKIFLDTSGSYTRYNDNWNELLNKWNAATNSNKTFTDKKIQFLTLSLNSDSGFRNRLTDNNQEFVFSRMITASYRYQIANNKIELLDNNKSITMDNLFEQWDLSQEIGTPASMKDLVKSVFVYLVDLTYPKLLSELIKGKEKLDGREQAIHRLNMENAFENFFIRVKPK